VQLTASEFRQLQVIASATASLACQGCSHICEPLVAGEVRVAETLRYLMYKECYGEPERALSLYRRLTPAERASVGVDFSKASAACPQKIDIASRMAVARGELGEIA
jgi:predicted aldo/keto reductase-like oxidoreductase